MQYKIGQYPGIDYSHGRANKDGICHFGVIPAGDVDFWWEWAEAVYPEAEIECEEFINAADHPLCYDVEPIGWAVDTDDFKVSSGEDLDVFVTKSPFFTFGAFCSPRAPGAIDLRAPIEPGTPITGGYCFGHDWFEDDVAPYPVYSVATGKRVWPAKVYLVLLEGREVGGASTLGEAQALAAELGGDVVCYQKGEQK